MRVLDQVFGLIGLDYCVMNEKRERVHQSLYADLIPDEIAERALSEGESYFKNKVRTVILDIGNGFSFGIALLKKGEILVVGPIQNMKQPAELFEKRQEEVKNGLLGKGSFRNHLERVPVMTAAHFAKAISCAVELMTDEAVSEVDILDQNASDRYWDPEITGQTVTDVLQTRELKDFHTSTYFENVAIEAIETGDVDALERFYTMPLTGKFGQLSDDPTQQEKFVFLAMITMASRAAIRGGLDEEVARSMLDAYCRHMDTLSTPTDILALAYKMGMDYCTRVAEGLGRPKYSAMVARCCSFIAKNVNEDIGLSDLAAYIGLSPDTVSKRFRQETGYSVPEYINRKKVEEATYLLRYTDMGLADIASYLKYSTQSYFTKIFHSVIGETPRRYREAR